MSQMFTCLYYVTKQLTEKVPEVKKILYTFSETSQSTQNILYSIAVSHNNCKVIMGAFGSKKGLKSCLIGDETLAKESLPTVSDSRWFSVGICKYKPGYKSHDLLQFECSHWWKIYLKKILYKICSPV